MAETLTMMAVHAHPDDEASSTGGVLATYSCSHHMQDAELRGVLAAATADAKRRVQVLEFCHQPPDHPVPSGDRRVARLLIDALECAGHEVSLVSDFSSYDKSGDSKRQTALRNEGLELAQRLVAQWRDGAAGAPPDLWFTYHVFYKAPDWLGLHIGVDLRDVAGGGHSFGQAALDVGFGVEGLALEIVQLKVVAVYQA